MKKLNCLVLEDSLNDQLSIEIILNQYPQIKSSYVKNSKEFQKEVSQHSHDLIIADIKLQDSVTGIDLIKPLQPASLWVIICSAYDSEIYYEQYKPLPFTKFYLQKPLDEFIFKTHIESFLFANE